MRQLYIINLSCPGHNEFAAETAEISLRHYYRASTNANDNEIGFAGKNTTGKFRQLENVV